MIRALPLLASLAVLPLRPADLAAGKVTFRLIRVSDTEFSKSRAKLQADQFIKDHGERPGLGLLEILTPGSIKAQTRLPDSAAYEDLVEHAIKASALRFGQARLVSLNGSAVLSVRQKSGSIEHLMLGNHKDPLNLEIGDLRLRMIELQFSKPPLLMMRYSSTDKAELSVWLTSSLLPDSKQALEIWLHLRELTGLSNLQIHIRTLPWWHLGNFPVFSPFERLKDLLIETAQRIPWVEISSYARGVEYRRWNSDGAGTTIILPPETLR